MNALVRFALFLLLAAANAHAGPFEDGIAAFDKQQYGAALELWQPLAEQGHRAAQFNVAVIYEKGLGVAQNPAEAARWYLKAAQQGDMDAQYTVGMLYETGKGFSKDTAEARKWYAAVMASPPTDPATLKLKERARERLVRLTSATEEAIPYKGGRFVIARSSEGACVVALQGTITKDGVSRFDEVIRKAASLGCKNPWLLLESPGGLLFEALDLGIEVRRAGFRTITRSACASACAMIFLGGTERILAGSRARIGLHQSSRGSEHNHVCDPTSYSSATREMSAYLKSVIPTEADQVMNVIMQTSCESVEWVHGQRAVKLGIATGLEWEGVEVGPARRAQSK